MSAHIDFTHCSVSGSVSLSPKTTENTNGSPRKLWFVFFFFCVVAQWNWALVFVVAIISLPCSLFFLSAFHVIIWPDVETMHWSLSFPILLCEGPATQEKLFMGFIKCVYQRMTEKPHKLLSNGNITVYGMCGNKNNVSAKQGHISLCVILFSSLVLQGNSAWLHAAVSLSITQHLKGNFWFC